MIIHIRKCPGCKEERPEEEVLCGNCGWDLTQEPLKLPGQIDFIPETVINLPTTRRCLNGHTLDQGDEMCFECGAAESKEEGSEPSQLNELVIDGWSSIDQIDSHNDAFEIFIVERHGHQALLTFYFPDTHPDSTIYEVIKRLPKDYVPELLAYGEWQGRRYEVTDFNNQSNLMDLASTPIDLEMVQQIVNSLGRILDTFKQNGLRHGNLRPENILIRHRDPLHLMLTGFQFSCISTFDLDVVAEPISARYTAPEMIAGGISVASDWWSLGMIILQLITNGRCFDEINEKAFRIHVVTRGISLPKDIAPSLNLLLRGLLARDPDQRWQWTQVHNWLSGVDVRAPLDSNSEEIQPGPALEFKEHSYVCPKAYSLAAAEATNWEEAKDLLMRGVIAGWLEDRKADSKIIAGVRLVTSIDSISDDFKHALALMWMNSNLPLIHQGDIITSSWLLQNPIQGYEIITGPVVEHLRLMNREFRLCDLHDRILKARERAKILEIELNEESFRILVLASSRPNLERQWNIHRRLFPGSEHVGLNSLMDRSVITDEELIVLLATAIHLYVPAEQILAMAKNLALEAGIHVFDADEIQQWLDVSRRELYKELENRTTNFSECGIALIDEWANDFRSRGRISLPKALALLSISKDMWKKLSGQQYIATLLEFYQKRISLLAQKGPLGRMLVNKSNSRVDLATIEGAKSTGSSILENLINRTSAPLKISKDSLEKNPDLEKKLRRLKNQANSYKKDTGIDSLFLGFPFLIMQDGHPDAKAVAPSIAPILLWPIKIDLESSEKVSIYFQDHQKDVQLNPALTSLIRDDELQQWKKTAKELLARPSILVADVMDAFGVLAEPKERILCTLPGKDFKVNAGTKQLVCSAVLFHAQFTGQAIGEDLREMQMKSPIGTALEKALVMTKDLGVTIQEPSVPEKDRYFITEADPSQERAVFRARQSPGLLIEGPPGTGKSQTIVNIIADCIGRKESVLVICQKSAALTVLAKRLNAEGLQDRFFYITDVKNDRKSVVQSIRLQMEAIEESTSTSRHGYIRKKRSEPAGRIESLESEIDKYHKAIHAVDEATGLSYRDLLGELIHFQDHSIGCVEVPALRRLLINLNPNQLIEIEEKCSSIAKIWLESSFEGSPLVSLNPFSSDTALINEFITILFVFLDSEKTRDEVNRQSAVSFEVEDPFPHDIWIKKHEKLFKKVDWKKISAWFQLFCSNDHCQGTMIINQLKELKQSLNILDLKSHDFRLSTKLIELPTKIVKKWLSLTKYAATPKTILSRFNPLSHYKRCRVRKILSELEEIQTEERITQLRNAADLELQQRPIRETILGLLKFLYPERQTSHNLFLKELREAVDCMKEDLMLAQTGITALCECPRQDAVESIVKVGMSAYHDLISGYDEAFIRHQARATSLHALEKITPFFSQEFLILCERNIRNNSSNLSKLQPIVESLPSLSAYQEFRLHVSNLSTEVLKIFSTLRDKEDVLKNYPLEQIGEVIRRLIAREARLAWKEQIEQKSLVLRLPHEEILCKIKALDVANTNMLTQNRKFLACNVDLNKARADEINRLLIPKNRSLREIIEQGWDIGLTQLRPVWLMTPEIASQLLPLKAGMFNVIIFDEASQIHIENALPTLFRAKRVIISGDEKQMPPANFFKKSLDGDGEQDSDDDDDDDDDDLDETPDQSGCSEKENSKNCREIKDCTDLLALGKMVLPHPAMLLIHYRSKYRELIACSNAAFYNNRLSIPVHHPESVIHDIRPIEVIRADGIYEDQKNIKEARMVIDLLAEKWSSPNRPSIGILTFNMKQAELIEDLLQERAETDQSFRQAFAHESERMQAGEDMSFFVKNVENVQGDERDMIIFSSTFGKDNEGVFKRCFGPLGQTGGERRLNVAITRAREKVILVTSLPINDISNALSNKQRPKLAKDYLQVYFDYASKISDGALEAAHMSLERITSNISTSHMDSNSDKDGFVKSVEVFLKNLGLAPISIKANDAFGLDFVIEDNKNKRFGIGIECDAHCHPLLKTARARELWRPKILRMGIPYVHRVTSYSWYHQREKEMEILKQAVENALGIELIDSFTQTCTEGVEHERT